MQRQITRGAAAGAGLIFHIFAQDSAATNGAGKASIAYDSWACRYIRNGEAISGAITPEDITTIGTYAAPTANTNIRIKAVDNTNMIGIYEVQIHADWVDTTNSCQSLTIYLTATGVAVLPIQIPLVALDPQTGTVPANLTQILGTALTETAGLIAAGFKKFFNVATPTGTLNSLPDAVPGANNGLPTTNGTKLNQTVDLTAGQSIAASSVPAVTLANGAHGGAGTTITLQTPIAATVPDTQKVDVNTIKTQTVTCAAPTTVLASVGTAATSTAQTGDSYALANGASGFVAIKGDTAAVLADTGTDGVVVAAASKSGYALSAAGVQAIWDALTSALTTVGSIGKKLADWVIGTTQTADVATLITTVGAAGAGLTGLGDARLANLDATVSSRNATTPPTVTAIRQEMDTNSTKLANLDATVSSRSTLAAGAAMTLTAAYDAAKTAAQAGNQMDLVNAPNATAVTAIQSGLATAAALGTVDGIADKLDTMLEADGPVYRFTANSLENSPVGSGGFTAGDRTTIEDTEKFVKALL